MSARGLIDFLRDEGRAWSPFRPRSVFATDLSYALKLGSARPTRQIASRQGHFLMRVDGVVGSFEVVVLSAGYETSWVRHVSQPIECRREVAPP